MNRHLDEIEEGDIVTLSAVLPNLDECPFIRGMPGNDSRNCRYLYVRFHGWTGESKREWQADGDEIKVPLEEFVKREERQSRGDFLSTNYAISSFKRRSLLTRTMRQLLASALKDLISKEEESIKV